MHHYSTSPRALGLCGRCDACTWVRVSQHTYASQRARAIRFLIKYIPSCPTSASGNQVSKRPEPEVLAVKGRAIAGATVAGAGAGAR